MKQPARNRDAGQRPMRDDVASASSTGRMAEIGALATAASAMAIGVGQAMERRDIDPGHEKAMPAPSPDARSSLSAETGDSPPVAGAQQLADAQPAVMRDMTGAATAQARDDVDTAEAGAAPHTQMAQTVLDPVELTGRIAEQIASSVRDVLDMAAGGAGSTDDLSRTIVEQARGIADGIHQQLSAQDPLAALADLLPPTPATEGLGAQIVDAVDTTLGKAGVMDLLAGEAPVIDAGKIVGDVVASLYGVDAPIDLAGLAGGTIDKVLAIPQSILGGVDEVKNPLAGLFYDDGGGDVVQAVADGANGVANGIAGLVTDTPAIGFLGQPLDAGGELGGLTTGHNPLQIL